MHLNLPSIEFSLLNIDTVVWLTGRHLNLQVILVLYHIFLDGVVFNLLLKQLRHLKLSCQAMTALRETVFPLVRNRLLEPKRTSREVHEVCSVLGQNDGQEGLRFCGKHGARGYSHWC